MKQVIELCSANLVYMLALTNLFVKWILYFFQNIFSELNIEKAKDAEIIIPEMVSKALSDWSSLSFDSKKLIAQTFIEKVVIYDVDIDIVYR